MLVRGFLPNIASVEGKQTNIYEFSETVLAARKGISAINIGVRK